MNKIFDVSMLILSVSLLLMVFTFFIGVVTGELKKDKFYAPPVVKCVNNEIQPQ